MKSIKVNLKQNSYNIYVGKNLINELIPKIDVIQSVSKIVVITNNIVADLYLKDLIKVLDEKYQNEVFMVPDGEVNKSLQQVEKIYSWLIKKKFDRNSLIIAFGGGVIGDLAGFVAATYLRGVRFIQIPTTLLAQVDSSIGGKVGVNHQLGKNLIGAFYQPQFVLSDINFLKTLNQDEYICGMGEIVKYALIGDKKLFDFLNSNPNQLSAQNDDINEYLVDISARQKSKIVEEDEKELGIRSILNFGHTFGHVLEKFYGYKHIKHGQAVLLGMKCAVQASQNSGYLKNREAEKIINLIDRFYIRLPKKLKKSDISELIKLMQYDKKVKNDNINFILIKNIENVFKIEIKDNSLIRKAFESLN